MKVIKGWKTEDYIELTKWEIVKLLLGRPISKSGTIVQARALLDS